MKRRILSITTAVALCLSLLPATAFATEEATPPFTVTDAETYTVTYDANGADEISQEVPVDSSSYSSGDTVTVLGRPDGLNRNYYTFECWNTAADGTGENYVAGHTFNITGNTTLYAKWVLDAVSPVITPGESVVLTEGYGAGSTVSVSVAEIDGHTLSYQWYTGALNSGTKIEGATESSYEIPTGLTEGTYEYTCIVTATRTSDNQTAQNYHTFTVTVNEETLDITVGTTTISTTGYYTSADNGCTWTRYGTSAPASGGYIHWDTANATLTLHNATITAPEKQQAIYYSGTKNLTVHGEGTQNKISTDIDKGYQCIRSNKSSVTLTGEFSQLEGLGVYTDQGAIVIEANISAISVRSYAFKSVKGNITIAKDAEIGDITVTAGSGFQAGNDTNAGGNITIHGTVGNITASVYGIVALKDSVTISETAKIGNIQGDNGGISGKSDVSISGQVGNINSNLNGIISGSNITIAESAVLGDVNVTGDGEYDAIFATKDVTIAGTVGNVSSSQGIGIRGETGVAITGQVGNISGKSAIYSTSGSVSIGTNAVVGDLTGVTDGIYAQSGLIIAGTVGHITVTSGSDADKEVCGLYGTTISIAGSVGDIEVTSTAADRECGGIYSSNKAGTITITGSVGNITARGTAESYGIYAQGDEDSNVLSIDGGSVGTITSNSNAIHIVLGNIVLRPKAGTSLVLQGAVTGVWGNAAATLTLGGALESQGESAGTSIPIVLEDGATLRLRGTERAVAQSSGGTIDVSAYTGYLWRTSESGPYSNEELKHENYIGAAYFELIPGTGDSKYAKVGNTDLTPAQPATTGASYDPVLGVLTLSEGADAVLLCRDMFITGSGSVGGINTGSYTATISGSVGPVSGALAGKIVLPDIGDSISVQDTTTNYAAEGIITTTKSGYAVGYDDADSVRTYSAKRDIAGGSLVLDESSCEYDGTAKTPAVTVTLSGRALTRDTDYTVSYSDNVNAANSDDENAPTVTVTGKGEYAGTITETFTITPVNISVATVSDIPVQTYTGSAITPEPTLTFNNLTLVKDVDYHLSYACNTDVGGATVTITGIGNYTKTAARDFTIAKADVSITAPTPNTLTYTGEAQNLISQGEATGGTMVYSLSENGDYTITIPQGTNAGDYTVWYYVQGDANHKDSAKASVSVTIGKAPLTIKAKNQGITYGMSIFQGTSNVIVGGLMSSDTLTGITLTSSGQNVGHWVITPSGATISGSADNYDITYETGALTISTASATPEAGNMEVTNGHAGTYTFDLSELLPDLDSGKSYGTVSYTLGEVNFTTADYYDTNSPAAISGSTLTLPIQAVNSTTEKEVGTITVQITSNNYIFADATIAVSAANKEVPQGAPTLTPASITYGQKLSAIAISGSMTDTQGNTVSGTFTWDAPGTVYTAGTHHAAWTFAPSDTKNYLTVHHTSEITVNKATGTGSVTMAGWTYGGTASEPVPTSATNGTDSVTYQYKVKGADNSTYMTTKPVNAGTYTVKATFAATANYTEATATADFTITGAAQTAPAAPELNSKTYNSVTLKTIEANANGASVEYSKDGGATWQTNPTFTGLFASTKYSFTARYAAVGNYAASPASDVTEITTNSAPSSGGGDSGGGYTPSTQPTQSVTIPISGDDNTIHVEAKVTGDKATVDHVDLEHLDEVIGDHVEDVGTVTIDFSGLNSSKPITTVEIPSNVVKEIAAAVNDPNNDAHSLEIVLSGGTSIEFDAVALGEKAAQADGLDITISIEHHDDAELTGAQKDAVGDRPAFDINVTSGGEHISDMGGKISVHLPYELAEGEDPDSIVVFYVDDHGNRERCETSYDPIKKRVNWKTDHLSLYMIDHCPSAAFADLNVDAWYHEATDYVIANGMMAGYGESFGPNDSITRGQIVTILHRLEDAPVVNYLMTYEDVDQEKYYTEAICWATSEGIVAGYGNGQFGPDDPITRQQLATMIYRYEQYKGGGFTGLWAFRLEFNDVADLSDYAYEPMCWCVMNGIVGGKNNGILDPNGPATRAQAAAMLQRYCELPRN